MATWARSLGEPVRSWYADQAADGNTIPIGVAVVANAAAPVGVAQTHEVVVTGAEIGGVSGGGVIYSVSTEIGLGAAQSQLVPTDLGVQPSVALAVGQASVGWSGGVVALNQAHTVNPPSSSGELTGAAVGLDPSTDLRAATGAGGVSGGTPVVSSNRVMAVAAANPLAGAGFGISLNAAVQLSASLATVGSNSGQTFYSEVVQLSLGAGVGGINQSDLLVDAGHDIAVQSGLCSGVIFEVVTGIGFELSPLAVVVVVTQPFAMTYSHTVGIGQGASQTVGGAVSAGVSGFTFTPPSTEATVVGGTPTQAVGYEVRMSLAAPITLQGTVTAYTTDTSVSISGVAAYVRGGTVGGTSDTTPEYTRFVAPLTATLPANITYNFTE